MASPTEMIIETRRIDGETIQIVQLMWPDGGLSYDVYRDTNGESECLTMDSSFDTIPTDDQIRDQIRALLDVGTEGSADRDLADLIRSWELGWRNDDLEGFLLGGGYANTPDEPEWLRQFAPKARAWMSVWI
jgi:hypothetical protein